MRVKIHEGPAARGGPSLCLSCRHATVIQGSLSGQQIVECGLLSSRDCRITFPVESCTGYSDRSLPSLRAMEEIAWVLRTDAHRKAIGFVRAGDLKPLERFVLDPDLD
jgi:hypothetical protein